MTTVLLAGSTGMLGGLIAEHLLEQEAVHVRLLLRQASPPDSIKAAAIESLQQRGATVAVGDLSDQTGLAAATQGVDVVVSAVQGRAEIIVDGQIALARAAAANGVRRFIPSDFALNLFAAPVGAPQFDLRRQADQAIDGLPMEVVHVLNGAFMDMMLDPATAGVVDLATGAARLWGTGNERFNLTTVDDTARFVALLATDPTDVSGIRMISGAETSFNEIIGRTEQLTGSTLTRQVLGDADDLRRITADAADPWAVVREWYFLSMLTVPPFPGADNARYASLTPTHLDDYLQRAHDALRRS